MPHGSWVGGWCTELGERIELAFVLLEDGVPRARMLLSEGRTLDGHQVVDSQ